MEDKKQIIIDHVSKFNIDYQNKSKLLILVVQTIKVVDTFKTLSNSEKKELAMEAISEYIGKELYEEYKDLISELIDQGVSLYRTLPTSKQIPCLKLCFP